VHVSFGDRVKPGSDVLVRPVGEESVLLNLQTETYFGLDAVGTRMWQILVEAPSIESALAVLEAEYEVGAEELRPDVESFLGTLLDKGLVAVVDAAPASADPATR
jgi:coenzyme PQQ synthesis protein D (PqqD)